MTLPSHRQISHGRTHAKQWDACDYAAAVKGYRPALPIGTVLRWVVGIGVVTFVVLGLALKG